MNSLMRMRLLDRSNGKIVREIEHSSNDHAFFSCDQIRLRVQSDLKFGCSISLINKRRSITELNSDSRPQHFIVKTSRRQASGTLRFCGSVPASSTAASSPKSKTVEDAKRPPSIPQIAGTAPAFVFLPHRRRDPRSTCQLPRTMPHAVARNACVTVFPSTRGTEFISVSGFRPERSALHSDVRLKRLSGSAAAPELPHAPMNSPDASCAGFPS
jgi:hypothetical protein